ncbi:MerR family transcriptional regulator [Pararobbsia alpina]|uniref:Mercuric resistance operon regulatory protein n=1 Tax=Pararobbsia alpina TaxID=621374 RepID=A0A6S7B168_9BURK|nr:helix-turn-helix domain-containing protein [Pararobbsia alpina]CAB3783811.1 Mercuric resistance operon regulatory protein [Pararobbsia alpina]
MSKTYSIGALSSLSGVNIETIRYYERVKLLAAPARSSNGYRCYDHSAAERLTFVRRGRELGFTVDEIRRLLELADNPDRPCADADQMVLAHLENIEGRIRDLQRMRKALREISRCAGTTAADCRLVRTLVP